MLRILHWTGSDGRPIRQLSFQAGPSCCRIPWKYNLQMEILDPEGNRLGVWETRATGGLYR